MEAKMTESKLYDLLSAHSIPVPPYKSIGFQENPSIDFFPAALKIESPKVVHKSEYGAVKLNITSNEQLAAAKAEIIKNVEAKGVKLDDSDRFIAVKMCRGEELYFGMVNDPVFGKTILFGKGGVLLELYKDVGYISLEADKEEVERALRATKISKLLDNFRGMGDHMASAVNFVQKLQKFIKANPKISEMDLNPVLLTSDGLIAVDARVLFEANAVQKAARKRSNFFDNKKVAVIGASTEPSKVGYALAKNALSFKGELYFVNAKGGELMGKPLYKSVPEIPGDVDTAVIGIPGKFILDTIEQLAAKKVKNVIVTSAGFKEVGDLEGEEKLIALVNKHNINMIGPNCLGYYMGASSLNLTFGTGNVKDGGLAVVSQSGAVLAALMDKAAQSGIGFSHIVSVGNMADLDFADLVEMLESDPKCKMISLYVEGMNRGEEFLAAVRKCKKPIYLFKSGRSEASKAAAFSHTGNLSGNYEMFKGLVEGAGCTVVDNIEALIFRPDLSNVKQALIVTNAGGPASVLTDYIEDRGKKLYKLSDADIKVLDAILPFNWPKANPVDIIGDAQSGLYRKTLEIAQEFAGVDIIYVIVTPQFMTDSDNIAVLLTEKFKKPVIPIMLGGGSMSNGIKLLKEKNILVFDTLKGATDLL
ncbi:MAG: acetate--CoA ligase family protein [Helicobacteraceae bacterium]|jgi:acyl-CoA synthetase (NDP forming)|nr:acetate--CoA ligase family protein [Helicobacteraceae bacterium]